MSFDMLKTRHDSPALLTWPAPLDVRMREGAHRFIERKTAASLATRQQHWRRDFSSAAADEESIRANRERFRTIIGAVDARLPAAMERFGDEIHPELVAETGSYRVFRVRWPVLKNVYDLPVVCGEGLLLETKVDTPGVRGGPTGCRSDAGAACRSGRGHPRRESIRPAAGGERFRGDCARSGESCPFSVGPIPARMDLSPGVPHGAPRDRLRGPEDPRRGRLVRTATRKRDEDRRRGIRRRRVGGTLRRSRGSSHQRRAGQRLLRVPADDRQRTPLRTVWGLLREFGDAEIASLIAPRGLVVEYSPVPAVEDQKGHLQTPPFVVVQEEFDRINALVAAGFQSRELICGPDHGPIAYGSPNSLAAFARMLGTASDMPISQEIPLDRRGKSVADERQYRQIRGMEDHAQGLIAVSLEERNRFFMVKVEPRLAMSQWGHLKPGEARNELAQGFIEKSGGVSALSLAGDPGRDRRPLPASEPPSTPVPGRAHVDRLRRGAGCLARCFRLGSVSLAKRYRTR